MALNPCPNCGKRGGKLADRRPARFPFAVVCSAYGWSTNWVRIAGVAEKLWNEAKKKAKKKGLGVPVLCLGCSSSGGLRVQVFPIGLTPQPTRISLYEA